MMFCKHSWEVLDKTVLLSGFEQMAATGLTEMKLGDGTPLEFFQKTALIILCCSKCGRIKKIVEKSI